MGQVLTAMLTVLEWIGRGPLFALLRFASWFYLTLIPFVLKYIGIPMFALGVLLALAFAGGTILFVIVFCIFMYFFIKGTIFSSKPSVNIK
jgi:hypothetical protein